MYAYNDEDGSTRYDVDKVLQISAFDPDFHNASLTVQPLPFAMMVDKYPMINGRGYPDTVDANELINTADDLELRTNASQKQNALIEAVSGDRILLRLSSLSTTSYHTIRVLGIPMKVIGIGARIYRGSGEVSGEDLSYDVSSITMGGGEAYDVMLDTTDVPKGTYFIYATNLDHLSNNEQDYGGMMTEIRLSAALP
jgi:FtsP/CotA-like multicopper oxidase with cupredoxin domain